MKTFSCFKPKDPFRNWSKELDKRVAMWADDFNSSYKLLLLGPAGAGKTTIMKQMKIIHFEGFSLEERQQKALEIRSNLLESVRVSYRLLDGRQCASLSLANLAFAFQGAHFLYPIVGLRDQLVRQG